MRLDRRAFLGGAAALALTACAGVAPLRLVMPVDPAATALPDLVDLARHIPGLILDIRYATADNFMGRTLYPVARALAQRPAADALARAQALAVADGYGLIVHDAYRPWRITRMMWDETPPAQREFVADPAQGSRHNRGCAIDCTLHRGGVPVEMPTPYDDFTPAAYRDYAGASPAAIANRERLERYMHAAGFVGLANEWWHFDWEGWRRYPIMDAPLA